MMFSCLERALKDLSEDMKRVDRRQELVGFTSLKLAYSLKFPRTTPQGLPRR